MIDPKTNASSAAPSGTLALKSLFIPPVNLVVLFVPGGTRLLEVREWG
jgi:hypothetical protein